MQKFAEVRKITREELVQSIENMPMDVDRFDRWEGIDIGMALPGNMIVIDIFVHNGSDAVWMIMLRTTDNQLYEVNGQKAIIEIAVGTKGVDDYGGY